MTDLGPLEGNPWAEFLPRSATSAKEISAMAAVAYEVARLRLSIERVLMVLNQIRAADETARKTHR